MINHRAINRAGSANGALVPRALAPFAPVKIHDVKQHARYWTHAPNKNAAESYQQRATTSIFCSCYRFIWSLRLR